MRLLEREEELSRLAGWLAGAAAGNGVAVLVGGEAGVGKTALARTFADSVGQGTRVVWGASDALTTPRALGPLLDIAAHTGSRLAAAIADEAPRDRLFDAFLSELDGARPATLAIIEDIHWADEATLDLVRFTARRLSRTHALLVITYRSDEVGEPLQVLLGDLATLSGCHRLALEPLTLASVTTMAGPGRSDAAALYRITAGNPFFVTEALATAGLPPTVRDAVLARAARLSARAREFVGAVAVIGQHAETELIQKVASPGPTIVEECVAKGMLEPADDGLRFRHELARLAVLDSLAPTRRRTVHRAVLGAMLAAPEPGFDPARIAHHAASSGDRSATLTYATRAAERAARFGAHREAAVQYALALQAGVELEPAARASLLEALAHESYMTMHLAEGIAALRETLSLRRQINDLLGQGAALRRLSRLLWYSGSFDDAQEAATAAKDTLEALPPGVELAWAYSNLAHLRMLADDVEGTVNWGQRAIDLAEDLQDKEVLAHALNSVGSARALAGEDGIGALERSLAIAIEAGFDEQVSRGYANICGLGLDNRNLESVDSQLEAGLRYCTEREIDTGVAYLQCLRCHLLLHRGQFQQTVELAEAALEQPSLPWLHRFLPVIALGQARARLGARGAWDALDLALSMASTAGSFERVGLVRTARAEAAWLDGDDKGSITEAEAGIEAAGGIRAPWVVGALIAACARAGGDVRSTAQIAVPFRLELDGNWAAAAVHWDSLGCPYDAAVVRAGGDDTEALRTALEAFKGLSARPMAARVARRLRQLGERNIPRGAQRATRDHPATLTTRESEVLALVCDGLSNIEIAARLFVSPKTAEHHVSAILAKLGVRSRAQATREGFRRGIVVRPPNTPGTR